MKDACNAQSHTHREAAQLATQADRTLPDAPRKGQHIEAATPRVRKMLSMGVRGGWHARSSHRVSPKRLKAASLSHLTFPFCPCTACNVTGGLITSSDAQIRLA